MSTSMKGTTRSGQEYESPLLVLTGAEYAAMPFQVLHDRLCTALRGSRPRLVLVVLGADSTTTLVFDSVEQASETALLTEGALAEDWNRPEEDEAWSDLQ